MRRRRCAPDVTGLQLQGDEEDDDAADDDDATMAKKAAWFRQDHKDRSSIARRGGNRATREQKEPRCAGGLAAWMGNRAGREEDAHVCTAAGRHVRERGGEVVCSLHDESCARVVSQSPTPGGSAPRSCQPGQVRPAREGGKRRECLFRFAVAGVVAAASAVCHACWPDHTARLAFPKHIPSPKPVRVCDPAFDSLGS